MGAASASNGAVGLFHVDGLTPEAKESGDSLIREGAKKYVIDDAELLRVKESYPVMWKRPNARPVLAFIGCPHLSVSQIYMWLEKLENALHDANRTRVRIRTVMTAAPEVVDVVRADTESWGRLMRIGVQVSSICPLMYMNNPLCAKKRIVTNSNKLRTYTTARYVDDDRLVNILVKGCMDE